MFNIWPKLNYHETQHKVWVSPKRFIYLPCGRQSGKTELALRRLVRFLPIKKEWADPKYFYAGPTYGQAKRTAWQRLINLIPPQWIAPNGISRSELRIQTIFGSELYLIGLDKPQRIEGMILDGGVIDENSDIKPGTFDLSILPTLVWRDGWCWFIGVPKRFGIGAVDYRNNCELAASGELADSALFTWPSEGIVPNDYLEMCRTRMDIRDFDEQFNAQWVNSSGGIFHSFDREFNVRPCIYDPNKTLIIGMDFNVDPLCWVICQMNGTSLDVIDEVFIRNTNTPAALLVLLNRYANHKGHFEIYGDASSRGRHTSAYNTDYTIISGDLQLKALGRTLHFDMSNPPVADRFAETNARIQSGDGQRHIYVDSHCKNLIRDLETRTYKLGTREADDSSKDSGHMSDALGYIIHKVWPLNLKLTNTQIITIRSGK